MAAESATNRSLGWTLGLTSVAFFMVALDALVVITALPAMQRDLGASLPTLQWTVNAYGITFAAGIITGAALGDRLGRRRVFTFGLVLFTLASAACALAPTASVLIAARTVQGLGAAFVLPLSLTILTAAFPVERRGAIVGIWGGIAGLAVASGPLIGGAVTEGLDWHWIFWVNVPIGVAATALSLIRLSESHGPAARLDLPGIGLVSAGAIGLVWGLVRANEAGWASSEIVSSLSLGALLLGAFVLWESRAREPMLPLRLFRIPAFAAGNATAFLMIGALFSAAFLVSQYFQFALGYSPLATGVRLLPWTVTPMLVAPVAGALSDRVGRRPVMVAGLMLQALGLGWIAAAAVSTGMNYLELVFAFLVAGTGISMALPTVPTAILSSVSPSDIGKASGTNNTMQRFGGVFAIAITSAVFAANGHLGSPASVTAGFRPALAVASILSVLAAITALAVAAPDAKPPPNSNRQRQLSDVARPTATRDAAGGTSQLPTSTTAQPAGVGRASQLRQALEGGKMDLRLIDFDSPSEIREFEKGRFEVYGVGPMILGRATYEPGWRWSEHVGASRGERLCQVEHVGVVLAGRAVIAMADGREVVAKAGEFFYLPPGHDSWVVGDEPYVSLHIMGGESYAA